jgi:tryptophan synthase alpha chain
MKDVLTEAERFKTRHDTPLVLMGYANPLHHYGIDAFCKDASNAGVDGLILADLSLEGADLVESPASDAGIELVLLVAPGTPSARITEIDQRSTGFVYAVSTSALTGDDLKGLDDVQSYLERARECVTSNPLLVGFGINRHELGMELSKHTDGFIVGSALVRKIEEVWEQPDLSEIDRLDAVARFTAELKFGPDAN